MMRLLSCVPLFWNAWRGPGAYGTRAPKELQHHLPALVLCRSCVSAGPSGGERAMRGSRLLDLRPPRYRCPAVPGLNTPPGRSRWRGAPPFFLWVNPNTAYYGPAPANYWRPVTAPPPAASPVALPALLRWDGTPLPNLPVRASAADAFTEEPHQLNFAAVLRPAPASYRWRPLITAGHPVRSPVPSPSCTHPGSGTPPPHRPANCTCMYSCLAVRVCQALRSSWLREKP